MILIFIGFILIIFGILGGVSFYVLFNLKTDLFWVNVILIYILVGFIMVSVSGWALIPSLLSSRFPESIRATASNLAYNGGLAIGFASPFIVLENFLKQPQHMEWLIFVPVILGAIGIIIGATRFISYRNTQRWRWRRWWISVRYTGPVKEEPRWERWWISVRYTGPVRREPLWRRRTRSLISNLKLITSGWLIVWIIVVVIVVYFVLKWPLRGEDVLTPTQRIQKLINIIDSFNLPKVTTSLKAPLNGAIKQLSHNNNLAPCNQLNAFLNQTSRQLTPQQAADLIQQATAIRHAIGCSSIGSK